MSKRVCIVTGTRAEYGLLSPLMKKIAKDPNYELQIIATGAHLSPEFGETYKFIEEDGFTIDEKVEILLSSDSSVGISKTMGLAVMGLSESIARLKPDLIILLGDRYETLAAAISASISKVPIAHLHGGETTEGAYDEAFRHSITKMSTIHFTSTEKYRQRVIQLGEQPSRVFNVGAIGIDNIIDLDLLDKEELEKSIEFKLKEQLILVTFHPVTLENSTSEMQFKQLLNALEEIKETTIIFTKANADSDGRVINHLIDQYVKEHNENAIAFISMGQLRYLSAMRLSSLVIGNSSSGIIEAPSFNIPTVNIGDRQKGRIQAKSIINVEPDYTEMKKAIEYSLSDEFQSIVKETRNPYGDGNTASAIMRKLQEYFSEEQSLKKTFYDLEETHV